jgi:Icc protein
VDLKNSINIVQITDLHLLADQQGSLYGVNTSQSLDAVLNAINQLDSKPQMCIATGDLAEDGTVHTYQLLQQKLQSLNMPVFVLPGNHDNTVNMAEVFINGQVRFESTTIIDQWSFKFLSSQVIGQSYGLLGNDQLQELDEYLTGNVDKNILLALHHPSFTVCPTQGCQLQDQAQLHALLAKHNNIKAIIAGHTHNDKQENSKKYIQYVTPSSFAFAEHRQKLTEHSAVDFWKGHELNAEKIGFRQLYLYPTGHVESRVVWAD